MSFSFFLVFDPFGLSYFPWLLAFWNILFLFELPHLSVVFDLVDSFFRVFHILLMIFSIGFLSIDCIFLSWVAPGELFNFSQSFPGFPGCFPEIRLIQILFCFSFLYFFNLYFMDFYMTLFQFSLVLFLPWEPVRASFNAYGPIEKFFLFFFFCF